MAVDDGSAQAWPGDRWKYGSPGLRYILDRKDAKMHAEKCPVCEGGGLYPPSTPDVAPFQPQRPCQGCGGKGWVAVVGLDNESLKELHRQELERKRTTKAVFEHESPGAPMPFLVISTTIERTGTREGDIEAMRKAMLEVIDGLEVTISEL